MLPAGAVRTGVRGHLAVAPGRVRTPDGELAARAVVVATDPATAHELLGLPVPRDPRPDDLLARHRPSRRRRSPQLHVDGDGRGPVVNTVVLSASAPGYSPDDRALVATTVLGAAGDAGTEAEVRAQLRYVYGADTAVGSCCACTPCPGPSPRCRRRSTCAGPSRSANGVFVAGDHRDSASSQGALVSGRRAADAVLEHLGLPVPARPPLDAVRVLPPSPPPEVARAR